jgi:hypothetical protein
MTKFNLCIYESKQENLRIVIDAMGEASAKVKRDFN